MNATQPNHLRDVFDTEGVVCVDLGLTDAFCDAIKNATDTAPKEYRTQLEYERDGNARIFHGWQYSPEIRELALHPVILDTLRLLFDREPFPFQTLNFRKGTQQPLHQDSIHFDGTTGMAGVWVALEDITDDSGPLIVCPRSHNEPRWDLTDLGWEPPERGREQYAYRKYERFLAKLAGRYEQRRGTIPKGHALIWHGNVIHGGAPVTGDATRYSQATHYFFEGGEYFCPLFSDPAHEIWSYKNIQDIREAA